MATYFLHETTAPLDHPSSDERAMVHVSRYYYDDIGDEVLIRRFHRAGGRAHFQNEERIPAAEASNEIRWRIKSARGEVPSPEDLKRTSEQIARRLVQVMNLAVGRLSTLLGRRSSLTALPSRAGGDGAKNSSG